MALTHNYGDTINFITEKLEEPITLQYLQTRSRHAEYLSKISTEYLLDAMNSYYEAHQLKQIQQAPFFSLTADEAENSSHKECFSMFITYFSLPKSRVINTFLGIVNSKEKTTRQIMDVITVLFEGKQLDISLVLFSELHENNQSVVKKRTGKENSTSPCNSYINCHNHRLA